MKLTNIEFKDEKQSEDAQKQMEFSESQLNVAIELYLSKRCFISALEHEKAQLKGSIEVAYKTLEKEVPEITDKKLGDFLNHARNAVKHLFPDRDEKRNKELHVFCSEREAEVMIKWAIENYRNIYGQKVNSHIGGFERVYYSRGS